MLTKLGNLPLLAGSPYPESTGRERLDLQGEQKQRLPWGQIPPRSNGQPQRQRTVLVPSLLQELYRRQLLPVRGIHGFVLGRERHRIRGLRATLEIVQARQQIHLEDIFAGEAVLRRLVPWHRGREPHVLRQRHAVKIGTPRLQTTFPVLEMLTAETSCHHGFGCQRRVPSLECITLKPIPPSREWRIATLHSTRNSLLDPREEWSHEMGTHRDGKTIRIV